MRRAEDGGLELRAIPALALIGLALAAAPAPAAAARRLAVVLGDGAYANLPPLPICPRSSAAMADALRKLGFEVSEIRDAANGPTAAALDGFARQFADPPDFVVVYACGYATGFDGRPFMLPVSAGMARPSDVLTQGMLAKSFINLVRGGTYPALVVLDAVPMPGSGAIGLGGMVHGDPLRPALFVATAAATDPTVPLTPLAAATIAAITAPDADAAGVLASLGRQLDAGASLATAGSAPEKAWLNPPPPPAAPPAVVAVVPQPVAPPPAAAPEPAAFALGEGDRRRVQAALKQLGLYPGAVDGVFGAETTIAVRRFQTVRGVEATGRLDAAQTLQLLGMVARPPP